MKSAALITLMTLTGAVSAGAQAIATLPLAEGMLSFDANASLGAFTGVTRTMTGHLAGASTMAGVRGWVAADTKTLSTNNGHRDHDMASSLEIDKYPTMRFDLDSVAVGAAAGDSTAVTLLGKFTIHGQQRPVSIPGFAWTTPERVRYLGSIVLDVKDYGVGGLTKMLGVLKMNEHITVHIDVTFAAGH